MIAEHEADGVEEIGYGYEALIGRLGESQRFNINWFQFLYPRDMARKLRQTQTLQPLCRPCLLIPIS